MQPLITRALSRCWFDSSRTSHRRRVVVTWTISANSKRNVKTKIKEVLNKMAAGQVTIDGKTYTKRHQVVPQEVSVTSNGQVIPFTLTLPGIAMFMLRGLTRAVIKANALTNACPFRFRLGNSDGAIWYSVGGVGGTTDRVLDSLFFGSGQFPYILDPFILYSVSASIKMEIEDVSQNSPYTIFFAFQGAWLLPTS